jgi:hypothetical protein
LDLTGRKRHEAGEDYIMTSSVNLYTKVTKSKRMRWAGHVACTGKCEMHTRFWSESLKGRNQTDDLGIDGRILEWIHLVQDRGWWWALVNMVMNFWSS